MQEVRGKSIGRICEGYWTTVGESMTLPKVVGHPQGRADLETASRALAEIVPLVVVTLGEKGCLGVCGDEAIHAPACDMEVVDTTCCGAAFNAGFLQAWRRGKALAECLQQGNAAGALVAGGRGNAAERLSPAALDQLRQAGPDSLSQ